MSINHVYKLGSVRVGNDNPVRIMGILNTSPESFFKNSIMRSKQAIQNAVRRMEQDGADIIDVGGMSTAPYLSTIVSEKTESQRVMTAIKAIQSVSDLPISVDTCRAGVAKAAFELGIDVLNDISGLKYDSDMIRVVSCYTPSVVLCAFSRSPVGDGTIQQTKRLLKQSVTIAKKCGICQDNIVLDPAIGFFRKDGNGQFYTKINSDWFARDLKVIQNLKKIKQDDSPLLVSVSNKSFVGRLFDIPITSDRVANSVIVEAMCVLNGADIIRTHNVGQTRQAVRIVEKISKLHKGL